MALLCLVGVGCKQSDPQAELTRELTKHTWGRELGSGALQETYVFHFFTNGTYRACIQNAFGMRAVNGTWRLSRGKEGKVMLNLENPEADYYCIWRESAIRYDKPRDVLLVSGGQLGGEQELRHLGLTNKPTEVKQPPKKQSWHADRRTVHEHQPGFRVHTH